MKTLIVGIINAKGGVGKTTSAMHLATALAPKFSVQIWDADPQGSASDWAQIIEENGENLPFSVEAVNLPKIRKQKPETEINQFRRVTVQADKKIDFLTIKKIMYTVTEAGAEEINFAVIVTEKEEL